MLRSKSLDENYLQDDVKIKEFKQNKRNVTSEQASDRTRNENQTRVKNIADMEESSIPTLKFLVKSRIHPQKLPPIGNVSKNESVSKKQHSVSDVFEVSWKNLSYVVNKSLTLCVPCRVSSPKVILKCLSGSFRSSELTAVMGPSGAGKSTLLSCVCGKRTKGVSGDINIIGCERIKVAIISQDDYLTDKLTLKEALVFASKVKNGTKIVDHEEIVKNVVNALNLEMCLNTRLGRCSGGQRRRISIALELVSKPNILILDEPTSGLDSSSCYQIVNNLKELTQQRGPMAVVATIHQPSARVFNLFDNIYVISHDGQCIYNGSPGDLLQQLSGVDLVCPTFHNPADYISEIASGEHGDESITKLAAYTSELDEMRSLELSATSRKLAEMSQNYKLPAKLHTTLLIKRSFKLIPREPHLSWIRLSSHILTAIFIGLIFGSDLGTVSGCPPRIQNLYTSKASDLFKDFEYESKKISENLGSIFYNVMFLMFAGLMPMIMVFPVEVNVFIKQYTNGWYSPFTYFISKIISDMPILVTVTTIYLTIWYLLSGQTYDLWRYGFTIIIGIMIAVIGQSQGIICSAIFSTNLVKASYLGIVSVLPFVLLSGFFVRTKRIPEYLRPITYLSYTRYGFESLVISIYGFERCWYPKSNVTLVQPPWLRLLKMMNFKLDSNEEDYNSEDDEAKSKDKAVKDVLAMLSGNNINTDNYNEYQSMVMSQFGFNDDMLYYNMVFLAIFALIFQVIAYNVLLWKVRHTTQ